MTVSLVFNDLSLRHQAPDRATVRVWMSTFVETLKTAVEHKITQLRIHNNFNAFMLSPNYPMNAWFNDNHVSRDERDFVLSYATQYPVIQPYDADFRNDEKVFEGRFAGDIAKGLGFTYLLGGLAFSILSESCWDTASLDIDWLEWEPESQCFVESCQTLRHISRSRHVSVDHVHWIENRIRTGVRTGVDLIQRANTLFPNLVFCKDASKQIEELTAASIHLPKILDRLFELEKLANTWEQNDFNYHQIPNASTESRSTMGRYGDRRKFVCPDGQRRLFEWHLKSLPQAWRIHFWADPRQKKILIGYVGKHLPTSQDPT